MADIVERLRSMTPNCACPMCSARRDAADEIERLRAALESQTEDPPSTFAREPDEDWEVIIKMCAIARARLKGDTRPIDVIAQEARDAWPERPA